MMMFRPEIRVKLNLVRSMKNIFPCIEIKDINTSVLCDINIVGTNHHG